MLEGFVSDKKDTHDTVGTSTRTNGAFVNSTVSVVGTIRIGSDMIFDGTVEGEVIAEGVLTIGEQAKIKGAIRTDFILSAEIIVIALGTVADAPFVTRLGVLCSIAAVMNNQLLISNASAFWAP